MEPNDQPTEPTPSAVPPDTPAAPAEPLASPQPAVSPAAEARPVVPEPAPVSSPAAPSDQPASGPLAAPASESAAAPSSAGTPTIPSDAETPAAPDAAKPYVGAFGAGSAKPPHSRRKKLLWVGGGTLAILLLAAGAVFGLYLPNTPAHVYETGLNRTGKALSTLVQTATEEQKLKSYTTSDISGSVNATVGGAQFSGNFSTNFDKISSDSGVTVSYKTGGGQSQELTLKALTQLPTGSLYPDVYLQVTGLKALGLDGFMPSISDYDGTWIYASSGYLKSLGSGFGVTGGDNTKSQMTSADIAALARTSVQVTQDYVFTTDPAKAVLKQKSFVGKETVDGVKTYHYKMAVNETQAKNYCEALTDAVVSTAAYKKLSGNSDSDIAGIKKDAAKGCADTAKNIVKDDGGAFDMWVDAKYKLIHKIRFTDPKNAQAYLDIGQNYRGGNKLSLFVHYVDDKAKTDGSFTLDTDVNASTTAATLSIKNSSNDSFEVTAKLNAATSNKAVKITKPANPVTIQDVLKHFDVGTPAGGTDPSGTDPSGAQPDIQSSAKDSERQTDLHALDSHLEAFYASNGYFPTLAQLNDPSWFSTNMTGLDPAALKDPDGTTETLATTATKTQYGYAPTNCNSGGCQNFTLSALLSNGTPLTLASVL